MDRWQPYSRVEDQKLYLALPSNARAILTTRLHSRSRRDLSLVRIIILCYTAHVTHKHILKMSFSFDTMYAPLYLHNRCAIFLVENVTAAGASDVRLMQIKSVRLYANFQTDISGAGGKILGADDRGKSFRFSDVREDRRRPARIN